MKTKVRIIKNIGAIILIASLLILYNSCGRKDFRRDYFTVKEVLSGNELLLVNDYTVSLIGIENTDATKNYLKKWFIQNTRIKLTFDKQTPFYRLSSRSRNKRVYAYVKDRQNTCLNTEILKQGLSAITFPQPYLSDSLENYLSYVSIISEVDPEIYFLPESEEVLSKLDQHLHDLIQTCDYQSSVTRDFAVSSASKNPGEFNIRQVCDVFSQIYQNWKYVNDPYGMEFFSPASRTILSSKFSGDCDDFAILMYSSIMAIGGESRIIFAFDETSGHAFAEINISNRNIQQVASDITAYYRNDFAVGDLYYREDYDGSVWLNLDYWANYPGGKYMDFNREVIFYPHRETYEERK